jgi:flagellar motor switch protein FliG
MAAAPTAQDTQSTQNDIASVVATLASRQGDNTNRRKLTGPERAAVLMLALGEQYGAKI